MIEKKLEELDGSEIYMRNHSMAIRDNGRYLKSNTKVGCCIRSWDGNEYETQDGYLYHDGCNFDMEWGLAIHAEVSAITNMIVNFPPNRVVDACYIYCEREYFTSCGNCRDWLHHFSKQNIDLSVYIDNGKKIMIFKLGELIPHYPRR